MAELVDLRSDTVTRPTAGMRAAMAAAEVGDDVYGEDPTVNALEAEVAALFGHEAALFTPTGSMANQIALQLGVAPGNELLCDADAHVVTYETGAAAAFGGISSRTWPAAGADIDPDLVASMIRPCGPFEISDTSRISISSGLRPRTRPRPGRDRSTGSSRPGITARVPDESLSRSIRFIDEPPTKRAAKRLAGLS